MQCFLTINSCRNFQHICNRPIWNLMANPRLWLVHGFWTSILDPYCGDKLEPMVNMLSINYFIKAPGSFHQVIILGRLVNHAYRIFISILIALSIIGRFHWICPKEGRHCRNQSSFNPSRQSRCPARSSDGRKNSSFRIHPSRTSAT
jgi:hypothetical protein